MRVVLDTNILVRANPRAAGSAIAVLAEFIKSRHHTLVLSPFILEEVERTLAYPRLRALWPLAPEEIIKYSEALNDLSEIAHPGVSSPLVSGDPHDDPVIETAILGRADSICTLDRHFYNSTVLKYLGNHGIEMMNDAQLLARLRESPGKKSLHKL